MMSFELMLVFWVVLIVLAVLLVRSLFNSEGKQGKDAGSTAEQILEERFARGEITQEQYLTLLKEIN